MNLSKRFLVTAPLILVMGTNARAAETPPYLGQPYEGKAIVLPGVVQAEAYDIAPDAKSGVTFGYDRDGNKNDVRKTPDAIGMARMGNGHVSISSEAQNLDGAYLGWTQTGEWMKYAVSVKEAGVYRFGGQFAAAGTDGLLSATFTSLDNAVTVSTGPLAIPTTAGYQPDVEVYHVWEKLDDLAEITLPKGDYILTVKIEKNAGFNLDYFSIAKK